jgi:hypothetical protein
MRREAVRLVVLRRVSRNPLPLTKIPGRTPALFNLLATRVPPPAYL